MPLLQKGEFMKSIGKNFIIAFLMILAIYQTAELWFGGFSSHNFFSFFDKSATLKQDTDINYELERIIVNSGDNKMLCRANDIYESSYKENTDAAITKVLRKGEIVSEGSVDWKKILQSKCIVYEYANHFGKEELEAFFGISNGNTDKVKSFNCVVLSDESGGARVTIANSDTHWGLEILADQNTASGSVSKIVDKFSDSGKGLYYISSEQNGFDIFNDNIFIPRWDGSSVSYTTLNSSLQYVGDEDKSALESEVNLFFDNPAGKWSTNVNNILNYSDESTVVKYYPNGVMEYSNYSTGSQDSSNDFVTNYKACQQMLDGDAGIENEFSLRDYALEGGQYTMYFGYNVENLPVAMSDELKSETGMSDYIEITASYGRVSKYRRYCVVYTADGGKTSAADTDFLAAVDNVYNELDTAETTVVDELKLSYIDDGKSKDVSLWWMIETGGKTYIRGTVKDNGMEKS
jgi:hypothetical protein